MVIQLTNETTGMRVKPGTFLGSSFYPYLEIVRNLGRYDASTKSHIVADEMRSELLSKLQAAGFSVQEAKPAMPTRGPITPEEQHAVKVLTHVANLDPDYARDRNGVGFSGVDAEFGHKMAEIAQKGIATEKQWVYILKLGHKYRKQYSDLKLPI